MSLGCSTKFQAMLRKLPLIFYSTKFYDVHYVSVGVLGQEWEKSEIHSHTPYKAFTGHEIDAAIGMKIGLASVNITLKSKNNRVCICSVCFYRRQITSFKSCKSQASLDFPF